MTSTGIDETRSRPVEVVVSGYSSMDRIIKVLSPLHPGYTSLVANKDNAEAHFGGCSVNIAYGMSRLGHTAAPCIRVGEDQAGAEMIAFLEMGGVSSAGISVVPSETTPSCYLLEDDQGNHTTVYYPGAMDGKYAAELDPTIFEEAQLGVMTVGSRADNAEFLRQCQENDVPLAFGMKADMDAFPKDFLAEVLDYSKIIFLNRSEQETIEELFGLSSITELFGSGSLEHLIVTSGREGSACYQLEDGNVTQTTVPIVEDRKFVTAIGAGDAYMAGFLTGYLEGEPASVCAHMGSTLASFAVEAPGAVEGIPTREEFAKRLDTDKTPSEAVREEAEQ